MTYAVPGEWKSILTNNNVSSYDIYVDHRVLKKINSL